MSNQDLKFGQILVFGTIAVPIGMIGLPIAIYLAPLYSGHFGISLGIVGGALIATRLLDLVTDPLIGIASDQWRPGIGRRRIWLIIGTVTLMAGVYLLFCPPPNIGAIYFVAAVSLAYFGLTTLRLPYTAWAGELSSDYHTRTKVSSTTQFFGIVGLLASTLIPAFMAEQSADSGREVMRAIGLAILVTIPVTTTAVFFLVPEPDAPVARSKFNVRDAVRVLSSNGPFMRISIAALIATLGEALRQSTTVFFARDVVGVTNIGQVYFFYFVAGLLAIPFWARLAKRIEKHRALALAMVTMAAANLAMMFVSYGDHWLFMSLFVAKGTCFAATALLSYSMIADTVDLDTAQSLDRQQGLFYSVEAMIQKLGFALGAGLPLIVLGMIDYNAEGETNAQPLQSLSLIFTLVPAVLILIAARLVWNYSLTRSRHETLQQEIAERSKGGTEAGALPGG